MLPTSIIRRSNKLKDVMFVIELKLKIQEGLIGVLDLYVGSCHLCVVKYRGGN